MFSSCILRIIRANKFLPLLNNNKQASKRYSTKDKSTKKYKIKLKKKLCSSIRNQLKQTKNDASAGEPRELSSCCFFIAHRVERKQIAARDEITAQIMNKDGNE
jgi:hypothetical protein